MFKLMSVVLFTMLGTALFMDVGVVHPHVYEPLKASTAFSMLGLVAAIMFLGYMSRAEDD